jgi:hypothetical protein
MLVFIQDATPSAVNKKGGGRGITLVTALISAVFAAAVLFVSCANPQSPSSAPPTTGPAELSSFALRYGDDNTISTLLVAPNPVFKSTTFSYDLTLPDAHEGRTLIATAKAKEGCSLKISATLGIGGTPSETDTGTLPDIPLPTVSNELTIKVTVSNDSSTQIYKFTIKLPLTTLKNLTLTPDGYSDVLLFNPGRQDYEISATTWSSATSLTLTPELDIGQSIDEVTVNDEPVAATDGSYIIPFTEVVRIKMTVTAAGAGAIYTILVLPAKSPSQDDSTLALLFAGFGPSTNEVEYFNNKNTVYSIIAPSSATDTVYLRAVATAENATIFCWSNTNSPPILSSLPGPSTQPTADGNNLGNGNGTSRTLVSETPLTIYFKVYSGNKGSSTTYTLTVYPYESVGTTFTGNASTPSGTKIVGISARDQAGRLRQANIATPKTNSTAWSFEANTGKFQPKSLFITFIDPATSQEYVSKAFPHSSSAYTPLNASLAADAGELVSCPQAFITKVSNNVNMALSGDLDLNDYVTTPALTLKDWDITSAFSRTFYGNGFTVSNIRLNGTSQKNVGLFKILADEAVVENLSLQINTQTPTSALAGTTSPEGLALGGLAAQAYGTVSIRNVAATGTIEFQKFANNVVLAPILGSGYSNAGQDAIITIENCSSTVQIDIGDNGNGSNDSNDSRLEIGGICGTIGPKTSLTLKNSYSTGIIDVISGDSTNGGGDAAVWVGGLIASAKDPVVPAGPGGFAAPTCILSIANCYTATAITINNTARATYSSDLTKDTHRIIAGGLVALRQGMAMLTIEKSAVVGALIETIIPDVAVLNASPGASPDIYPVTLPDETVYDAPGHDIGAGGYEAPLARDYSGEPGRLVGSNASPASTMLAESAYWTTFYPTTVPSTFNDNRVNEAMRIGYMASSSTFTGTPVADTKEGANESLSTFQSPAVWAALGFDTNIWKTNTGALPTLK